MVGESNATPVKADIQRRRTSRVLLAISAVIAVIFAFLFGFLSGRLWEVPETTQFWTIAAQPLATFGAGALALSAAVVAFYGVHISNGAAGLRTAEEIAQRVAANDSDLKQRDNAAQVAELWKRFEWIVDHLADTSPGAPLLDEDQATDIIIAIRDSAETCGDQHLSEMLDVFMGGQINNLSNEIGLEADNARNPEDTGAQRQEASNDL